MAIENLVRNVSAEIGAGDEGRRLDVWLGERFTYHSRSAWQNLVRDGKILLNGRHVRCSAKLRRGDLVSFVPDRDEPPVDPSHSKVYEDEFFMIVEKSGNLPCHPAGPFFQNTLWYHLHAASGGNILFINRLDRETSGLVIAARDPATAAKFAASMDEPFFRKKYIAIVFGEFPALVHAKGILVPDGSSEIRKKRRFILDGHLVGKATGLDDCEEAAEYSETILRLAGTCGGFSLVEAELVTGRMHQIRATLFSLGFPLAGDKIYGTDDTAYVRFVKNTLTEEDLEKLGMARQALHSASLEFNHPVTGAHMEFSSPMPADMRRLIEC